MGDQTDIVASHGAEVIRHFRAGEEKQSAKTRTTHGKIMSRRMRGGRSPQRIGWQARERTVRSATARGTLRRPPSFLRVVRVFAVGAFRTHSTVGSFMVLAPPSTPCWSPRVTSTRSPGPVARSRQESPAGSLRRGRPSFPRHSLSGPAEPLKTHPHGQRRVRFERKNTMLPPRVDVSHEAMAESVPRVAHAGRNDGRGNPDE